MSSTKRRNKGWTMVVCIYGPGGNFNGRYPQEVNAPVKDPAACAGESVP